MGIPDPLPTARWQAMLAELAGLPPVPPPRCHGRVHRLRDDDDWMAHPPSATELAQRLGVSRQAAHGRLRAFRRTKDLDALLSPARGGHRSDHASHDHGNRPHDHHQDHHHDRHDHAAA